MLLVSPQRLSGRAAILTLSALSLLVRAAMLSLGAQLVRSAMFFARTLHLSVLATSLPARALLPLVRFTMLPGRALHLLMRATMLVSSALCLLMGSVRPPVRSQRLLCCDVTVEGTLSGDACYGSACVCAASVGACGDAACSRTATFSVCYAAAFARTAPVSARCEAVGARAVSAVAGYNAARAHTTSVGACRGPVYVLSASLGLCCEDTAGTSLQLLVRLGGRNCTIPAVCTLHDFPRTLRARRETDLETWNFVCFYVFPFLPVPGSESLNSEHCKINQRSTETITNRQSPKHTPTHLLTFCVTL